MYIMSIYTINGIYTRAHRKLRSKDEYYNQQYKREAHIRTDHGADKAGNHERPAKAGGVTSIHAPSGKRTPHQCDHHEESI